MFCMLSQNHLLRQLFFPLLNFLSTLVENQLNTDRWIYFWTLSFVLLICMSDLIPVTHSLDYCSFV